MNPPTIFSYSLGDKIMKTVVQRELPPPVGPKVQSSESTHKLPQSTVIRNYANMVRIGVHSVANSRSVRPTCCCKVRSLTKLLLLLVCNGTVQSGGIMVQ